MPVNKRIDSDGKTYYQWGKSGKRYYYSTKLTEARAKEYATRQGRAIERSISQRPPKKLNYSIRYLFEDSVS